MKSRLLTILLLLVLASIAGCAAVGAVGAMAQANEYQKKIQVLPKYEGLNDKVVAVVVDADMSTLYERPQLPVVIATGVAVRIKQHVPQTRVLDPRAVIDWQYRVPNWNALPYGEMAEQLGVDRVVLVDVFEYRLNPPGNRWEWEGAAGARVSVVEKEAIDPDLFAATFDVASRFPTVTGLTREDATPSAIETGLLGEFIQQISWIFYEHEEPKYPDQYRPELDRAG